jgi:hypothetical protein
MERPHTAPPDQTIGSPRSIDAELRGLSQVAAFLGFMSALSIKNN